MLRSQATGINRLTISPKPLPASMVKLRWAWASELVGTINRRQVMSLNMNLGEIHSGTLKFILMLAIGLIVSFPLQVESKIIFEENFNFPFQLVDWEFEGDAFNMRAPCGYQFTGCGYMSAYWASYIPTQNASMKSPWIDLTNASSAWLQYVESLFILDDGSHSLYVEIGPTQYVPIFEYEVQGYTPWTHRNIDLTQFAGNEIRLKWFLEASNGYMFFGFDLIFFDNVIVHALDDDDDNDDVSDDDDDDVTDDDDNDVAVDDDDDNGDDDVADDDDTADEDDITGDDDDGDESGCGGC